MPPPARGDRLAIATRPDRVVDQGLFWLATISIMRIVGHGIDLVETDRVARMLDEHAERFLRRVFTDGERAYCDANVSRRLEHLAGRFAAKEAILKVLGTGWSGGIAWTDAEVIREPSGKPTVRLHGRAADVAADLGVAHWWLSISHVRGHAMASAIGVAND